MAERVLVPVDDSDRARDACRLVFEEFPEAEMVLLHVVNPGEAVGYAGASLPSFSEEWYENEKERAEELFEEVESAADDHGIDVERALEVGKPSTVIVEFAEENDVDHIVMGSHGREGVTRILLGSVAEAVVRRSPVPVTVAR